MDLYFTGYGSMLVPRVPFSARVRPPKLVLECGSKVVWFGPAGDGLGFAPEGDATVEDVTLDVEERASAEMYSLETADYGVPVTDAVTIFSADPASGHSFEAQLDDATAVDEMLWIQGPFDDGPLDLGRATGTLEVMGEAIVGKRNGTARWRETRYEIAGTAWRKRFYAVTLFSTGRLDVEFYFALLAQAPETRCSALFDLADRWAGALGSRR
jgi:hypothetical protein